MASLNIYQQFQFDNLVIHFPLKNESLIDKYIKKNIINKEPLKSLTRF